MSDYGEIILLIERRKYEAALERVEQLLQQSPDDSELYFLASICSLAQKQFSKARTEIERSLELDPNSALKLNQHATIEIEEKRYVAARDLLSRAMEIDPNNEETYALLSRINLEEGHIEEMTHSAQILLSLDPRSTYAQNLIILQKIINREFRVAGALVTEVLAIDPMDSFSQVNYSLLQFYEGKREEAIQSLLDVLSSDPENEGIKDVLKQVMISRNLIADLLFRLSTFTLRNRTAFKVAIGVGYRAVLIVGAVLYLAIGHDDLTTFLLVVLLCVYGILFIPYRILPQGFTLLLLSDPIGKHLQSRRELLLASATLTFFAVGLTYLALYLSTSTVELNDNLVIGLFFVFLAGLPTDLGLDQGKSPLRIHIAYLLIGIFLASLFQILPEISELVKLLMLIMVWSYALILKYIKYLL